MIYELKCKDCESIQTLYCSIDEREEAIERSVCSACGSKKLFQKLSCRTVFSRSEFPKGYWEHLGPEPTYVGCENQLKDICQERGFYSKLLEDGK